MHMSYIYEKIPHSEVKFIGGKLNGMAGFVREEGFMGFDDGAFTDLSSLFVIAGSFVRGESSCLLSQSFVKAMTRCG